MTTKRPAPAGRAPRGGHDSRGRQQRMLRIIAGQWRSRRFRFPPLEIRPTPDRVRETLFNWLQTYVEGSRCLDLFAGSGALGLEALSRGAAVVTFVEQQRAATDSLQLLLQAWQAQGAHVVCDEVQRYLSHPPTAGDGQQYDIVFVDPPYAFSALEPVLAALSRGWLKTKGRIYVEHARSGPPPQWPASWRELRAGVAGEVGYHLLSTAERGE